MGREGHIFPSDLRKWILFDSSGQSCVLENVSKHAIKHRVQIHVRDLRILDLLLSCPSTIMGRERAIVLNLEQHTKSIITADEVLLRDPCESPFEFQALEVALEAICSFLAAPTTDLETAVYPALDEFTSKISSRNLNRIRKLKSAMTRLTARVQKLELFLTAGTVCLSIYALVTGIFGVNIPYDWTSGHN